jgi:hypothetical protein
MLGSLDSGASHVFVNTTGRDKLLMLGLTLKTTPLNSCLLTNDTLVGCLGAISVPFRVHKICLIDALVLPSVKFELVLGRVLAKIRPHSELPKSEIADDAEGNRSLRACDLNNLHGVDDLGPRQRAELKRIVSDYFNSIKGIESINCKNYRVSPYVQNELDNQWKDMLRLRVIRRSDSEWNSPAFMVPKPDDTRRFVVNYQQLNVVSKRPAYPLPNMTDILNKLGNARYLTSPEIRSAYWEVPVEESSRKYTAFSILGRSSFEFFRMLFGLYGVPGTFQALADKLINIELAPYAFSTWMILSSLRQRSSCKWKF